MILQMHFQDVKDTTRTEFVAQSDELESSEQVQEWTRDVSARRELPDGKQWLVCDETAECFARTPVVDEG